VVSVSVQITWKSDTWQGPKAGNDDTALKSSAVTAAAAAASISPISGGPSSRGDAALASGAALAALAAICTFAVGAVGAVCAIGTGENTKAIAMGASLLTIPVACIVINGEVATF